MLFDSCCSATVLTELRLSQLDSRSVFSHFIFCSHGECERTYSRGGRSMNRFACFFVLVLL